MKTKAESIQFPRADFYIIYPFFIDDWSVFEKDLGESGIWEIKRDINRQSIKNLVHCYLGEDEAIDFPIHQGLAYMGNIQKSKNSAIASFAGEAAFRDSKGELLFSSGGKERTFWPDFEIELHITPSRHGGVAVLRLSTGMCPVEEAVEINYTLQKCDPDQIPTMCSYRGGEWVKIEGRETLKELFNCCLPEGITPMNDSRFLMASNIGVDTSSHPDDDKLEKAILRLGMVKNWKYKILGSELDNIKNINKYYSNIWTYVSHEGFATLYMTPDMTKEGFLQDFHGKYPKSYLPVYLVSILAELTYLGALKNPDIVAQNPEESDLVRETNLVLNFEPSHYSHLNALLTSMIKVMKFDKKYEIILSQIQVRAAQMEAQRLQIEKKNQKLAVQREMEAEQARKRMEEEKKIEAQIREERDRDVNYLLGFIGIGQVIFAIFQLLGANDVAGWDVANSTALSWASIIFSIIFFILILAVLIRAIPKRKKNAMQKEE